MIPNLKKGGNITRCSYKLKSNTKQKKNDVNFTNANYCAAGASRMEAVCVNGCDVGSKSENNYFENAGLILA